MLESGAGVEGNGPPSIEEEDKLFVKELNKTGEIADIEVPFLDLLIQFRRAMAKVLARSKEQALGEVLPPRIDTSFLPPDAARFFDPKLLRDHALRAHESELETFMRLQMSTMPHLMLGERLNRLMATRNQKSRLSAGIVRHLIGENMESVNKLSIIAQGRVPIFPQAAIDQLRVPPK